MRFPALAAEIVLTDVGRGSAALAIVGQLLRKRAPT
jgi:hypothetical protein